MKTYTGTIVPSTSNSEQQKLLDAGQLLPLMEEFYTIQGEGFHTGKPAYFIRLGGCDVGCHWCDVKESWDANTHPLTAASKIVSNSLQYPARAVVITGGEPSAFNLAFLTHELKKHNVLTFIETSGAYDLTGTWDWICLSPKKTSPAKPEIFKRAHELKVIIYNNDDFKWAEENAMHVNENTLLYLQPEWSKSKLMTPLIVDYVMKNPKWNISLQTHKYMNIP